MILKFLKTYLENNPTYLPCPYNPLLSTNNPTKVYLNNVPSNAANNVISIHETTSTNNRPTFWNGVDNPPEVRISNILLFVRSKMSSDTTTTPLADGDYDNVRQTAFALRDSINRISQVPYSDINGNYVIDQVRPISGATFDRQDGQGRNIYIIRFEAIWTWASAL